MDEQKQKTLDRAKAYIDKLANGYDPFTNEPLEKDSLLNNVRLSRCFFFVSDILQEVIDNGGVVNKGSSSKQNLPKFELQPEQRSLITALDEPILISDLCNKINELANLESMRKLKVTAFGAWLLSKGFLTIVIINDKKHKEPTSEGRNIGILSEWVEYQNRGYYRLKYNKNAQQFLIDNLDEIIQISNGE
ncbi:MAG: hypothetical protein LBM65_04880 [Oscillospiraceae bacterium]|jgi:hypothetical protein|nr:hypothetical protein [Oscillospiraceae bacterium]